MTYFVQVPKPSETMQLTDALAEAVAEAAKLCPEDQNYIAFRIMEEVAEEKKWTETNTSHSEKLPKLAIEALGETVRARLSGRDCPGETVRARLSGRDCPGETVRLEDFLRDGDA